MQDLMIKKQELLIQLENLSFVAHRDALENLPAIENLGLEAECYWLETGYQLFTHDRDAGKTYFRATPFITAEIKDLLWIGQALTFSQWTRSWQALEGFLENITYIYQKYGQEGEKAWFEQGLLWCQGNLINAATYFKTPFHTLFENYQDIITFLQPAHTLYQEKNLPLSLYLEGALKIYDFLDLDGLIEWARMGADILNGGRTRGEAYFALESEESISLLLANLSGFSLKQHRRLWQLILYAWYEVNIDLQEYVCFSKHADCMIETNGRSLFLPPVLPSKEYAMLALFHSAGHIVFKTYDQAIIYSLFQKIDKNHPPIDKDTLITWRPIFAEYKEQMFKFQILFDICEDLRINYLINKKIPNYLTRLINLINNTEIPKNSAEKYFIFAKHNTHALLNIENLDKRLQPLLAEQASLITAFEIANILMPEFPDITIEERIFAYLPAHGFNMARAVYPTVEKVETTEFAQPENTETPLSSMPEKSEKTEMPKDAAGDDPDLEIPPEETAGSGGRVGVGIPMPTTTFGRGVQRFLNQQGIPYPEWDYRINDYIPYWCRILEQDLTEQNHARVATIQQEYAAVLKRLQQVLQQQKPQRLSLQRKQLEGDNLDIEACVQYVTDKKASLDPKPFIYQKRNLQKRDISVYLLADLSTSIMSKAPSGGKVVDRLRAGLILFAQALETIGDSYAISGFASKYHDNIHYYKIKSFEQKLTQDIKAVIAGISGRLASRMGAAIRHTITLFKQQGSTQKLLLILSDGRPADYDDGGDIKYLHEDTRRACKEAIDQGIHPFCITLDANASEYLPFIFGHGHYLILDKVDDLPKKLPEIYLRLRR